MRLKIYNDFVVSYFIKSEDVAQLDRSTDSRGQFTERALHPRKLQETLDSSWQKEQRCMQGLQKIKDEMCCVFVATVVLQATYLQHSLTCSLYSLQYLCIYFCITLSSSQKAKLIIFLNILQTYDHHLNGDINTCSTIRQKRFLSDNCLCFFTTIQNFLHE